MDQQQQPTDNQPVIRPAKRKGTDIATIVRRVLWYITGLIITFLALRIVLLMLAADQANPFVHFVYRVAGFYAYPFQEILGEPTYGQFYFDYSGAVAILAYALFAAVVCKIVSMIKRNEEA